MKTEIPHQRKTDLKDHEPDRKNCYLGDRKGKHNTEIAGGSKPRSGDHEKWLKLLKLGSSGGAPGS